MRLLEAWAEIRTDSSKLVKGLRTAETRAAKAARKIEGVFSKIGFKGFLVGAISIYGIQRALKGVIAPAVAFESQLAMVSTMLDKSAMYIMPQYKEELQAMSIRFGEATDTLSKGLYDILSASIAPEKALKVLEVSAKAATAGLTDTGTAADAITTILNAYGLAAEQAGYASDILFGIVKRGKTTFAELAPAIGKVATLAAKTGLSLEELGANIASITRAGIRTDEAMTAIAGVLRAFLKPTEAGAKAAKNFGFELESNTLRTIGLIGVMEKLTDATEKQLAAIFPNIRGLKGIIAAMGDAEGYAKDYAIMLNSLGLTQEAYEKRTQTTAFQLGRLKMQWEALKVMAGEEFLPVLQNVIKSTLGWFETNKELVKVKIGEWVGKIAEGLEWIYESRDVFKTVFGGVAQIADNLITIAENIGFIIEAAKKIPQAGMGRGIGEMGITGGKREYPTGGAAPVPMYIYSPKGELVKPRPPAVPVAPTAPPSYFAPGFQASRAAGRPALGMEGLGLRGRAMAPGEEVRRSWYEAKQMVLGELPVFEKGTKEMTDGLAENWESFNYRMTSSWGNSMGRMIAEGRGFKETMDGFFKDITYSFVNMATKMAAEKFAKNVLNVTGDSELWKGIASKAGKLI